MSIWRIYYRRKWLEECIPQSNLICLSTIVVMLHKLKMERFGTAPDLGQSQMKSPEYFCSPKLKYLRFLNSKA